MDIIKVEQRSQKASSRQLRQTIIAPRCIYGGSLKDSLSIQTEQQSAEQPFQSKRTGSKLQLDLSGKRILVQIKEKTEYLQTAKLSTFSPRH